MAKKNHFRTLLMVVLAMTSLAWYSCAKEENKADKLTGNISGTVRDYDTHEPIQMVLVTLNPGSKDTYTDMNGQFEYTDLKAQQYTVTVQQTGYSASRKIVSVDAGETTNVNLVMKADMLTGNISGTVRDYDTHEPIQMAYVTLSPGSKDTYTSVDGQFEFTDLEAQQYSIIVQQTGYQANRKLVTVSAGETVVTNLVMRKQ